MDPGSLLPLSLCCLSKKIRVVWPLPPGLAGEDAKYPMLKWRPPLERWTHSVTGAWNAWVRAP